VEPLVATQALLRSMITAAQCRSARSLLSWSLSKLASAASTGGRLR
jgi:hypothetical protein